MSVPNVTFREPSNFGSADVLTQNADLKMFTSIALEPFLRVHDLWRRSCSAGVGRNSESRSLMVPALYKS
eukprot:11883800-Alexandrium_andersonii.AAC.1